MALAAAPVLAWWDGGHMLTAEIAAQLMTTDDVAVLQSVLHKWDDDFPNTGDVATAVIWPDLLKCASTSATYCPSPLRPSVSSMDNWHYVNLPFFTNGSDYHGVSPRDVNALLKASLDGLALDVMTKTLKTFATTQSNWAANFMLRYFLHAFTDIHQPMHTATGVSDALPNGDLGGNKHKFAFPCSASNLHAIWDSAAGEYSTNWTPNMVPGSPSRELLRSNATRLIAAYGKNLSADAVDYAAYKDVPYAEFAQVMTKDLFPRTIVDSFVLAKSAAYEGLDLTFNAKGFVPCPSPAYQARLLRVVEKQFVVGGSRLAVVLTQLARQLKALGLAAKDGCGDLRD
ncbi:hypothetical protein SDRG_09382 [Saprolegnia diclina VS20]|uniref:S1/P1 nuclease n=1 Tax=Saprolegnia diclina (strain VS20) TaxID=1156394 RepID=T0RRS4_SAPDV|nr:hypothetical protein SDRG_09382 [Saprolegnia diclina VS20]EQC32847.1 hypothetical protein SDRG_09382 [Saprolegnia diclina VS20]|eukprot:XP_008613533.1 hypothetical protein SDRG_09382 [Saprolegnia diclina VS20]